MDWTETGPQQEDDFLPLNNCQFNANEFSNFDAIFDGLHNQTFDESIFTNPTVDESVSGHSSDSGNYSPSGSSLPESASNFTNIDQPWTFPQQQEDILDYFAQIDTPGEEIVQEEVEPFNPALCPQNIQNVPGNVKYQQFQHVQNQNFQQTPSQRVQAVHRQPAQTQQQFIPPQMVHQQPVQQSQCHPNNNNSQVVYLVRSPAPATPMPLRVVAPTPVPVAHVQPAKKVLLPSTLLQQHCMLRPVKMEIQPTAFHPPQPKPVFIPKSSPPQSQQPQHPEEFVRKKEDRKMRNRAAAQVSRQKKREEQDKLRTELEQSRQRCARLEAENGELRQRVQLLEQEKKALLEHRSRPKEAPSKSRAMAKTATAGVCMLMLFGWMVVVPPNEQHLEGRQLLLLDNKAAVNQQQVHAEHAHGRLLDDLSSGNLTSNEQIVGQRRKGGSGFNGTMPIGTLNGTTANAACTSRVYNESLNIKLSEDLFTWVLRHEKMEEMVQLRRGKLPPLTRKTPAVTNNIPPLPKLRINSTDFEAAAEEDGMRRERNKRLRTSPRRPSPASAEQYKLDKTKSTRDLRRALQFAHKNKNGFPREHGEQQQHQQELLPTGIDVQQMLRLVRGVRHRNSGEGKGEEDATLYVIPLHDYFLLPPKGEDGNWTGYGKKAANLPKLSIILPALSPPQLNNSTAPFNQLSMIRIECEVVGTNLFYLPEGLVNSLSYYKVQSPTTSKIE